MNHLDQWELLDSAAVPKGGFMRLMRRGAELVIRVDGRELMSNRVHGSEDALADLACDQLEKNKRSLDAAKILIGGLGIGFTLAAALRRVGPDAVVTVAELVPAVVEWNRGILGESAGNPVNDPRTVVYTGDVADKIKRRKEWDAVLLDVDNGPEGLTKETNNWLYDYEGLSALLLCLAPGGVLGVWSAAPNESFTRRLLKVGFRTAVPLRVRARGNKGGMMHIIWICTV